MKIGLHLFTRDGRVVGNAIITGPAEPSLAGEVWPIETDFGNTAKLTAKEIESQYYTLDSEGVEKTSDVRQWRDDSAALKQDNNPILP